MGKVIAKCPVCDKETTSTELMKLSDYTLKTCDVCGTVHAVPAKV